MTLKTFPSPKRGAFGRRLPHLPQALALAGLLLAAGSLSAAPVAGGNARPILLEDGLFSDVVVEAGALPAGYGNAITDVIGDGSTPFTFFEAGLPLSATGGLPASGLFTSVVDPTNTFSLEPATQYNANQLFDGDHFYPGEGPLRFAIPQAFPMLFVLATSVNGSSTVTGQINFADGTPSAPFTIVIPSAETTASAALSGLL